MTRKSKRAVGIKYNEAEPSQAPTIVAKGYDDLAEAIIASAKAKPTCRPFPAKCQS